MYSTTTAHLNLKSNTVLYRMTMEGGKSRPARRPGRARDPDIDARVLAVASTHLSTHGYQAMSLTAVAREAGTTRQALYRRWPTKASLASAALHGTADLGPAPASGDPLADLAAELADFQRGVSRPGRLSLAGTMLQDSTEPELLTRYRARVVAPRRSRIRAILHRARQLGLIDPDADLEVAVTLCTGSWYARALAGSPPPANWPARTAALVWRAVGGVLPEAEETNPSQHDGGQQQ
jgi:AcrR family transcriptional regulator